jgi:hypothetical protein
MLTQEPSDTAVRGAPHAAARPPVEFTHTPAPVSPVLPVVLLHTASVPQSASVQQNRAHLRSTQVKPLSHSLEPNMQDPHNCQGIWSGMLGAQTKRPAVEPAEPTLHVSSASQPVFSTGLHALVGGLHAAHSAMTLVLRALNAALGMAHPLELERHARQAASPWQAASSAHALASTQTAQAPML